MLKNIGLFRRVVLPVLVLDLVFTVLFTAVYFHLMNTPSFTRVAVGMAVSLVVRVALFAAVMGRAIRPTMGIIGATPSRQRTIAPEALRQADHMLQTGILQGSLAQSLLWGVQMPVMTLVESSAGNIGAQGAVESVTALLAAAGALSAFALTLPLLYWRCADALGDNAITANRMGVELSRPPSTIPARIMVLAICLCAMPSLLVAALGISMQTRSLATQTQLKAELASWELNRQLEAGAGLDKGASAARGGSTTYFLLDRAGGLRTAGFAAPTWLDPTWVRRAALGATTNPERGTFAHVIGHSEGALLGAATRLETSPREYFIIALPVMLMLALWGAVCAWIVSRSVADPVETASAAARRIVEEGDLSKMGNIPVAHHDEAGLLLINMNELVNMMRELARASGAVGAGNLEVPIVGQGELPEAFRLMVANLRQSVQQMHATSAELGSAATEIFAATQEQEAASASHSSGMVEITQTMDSLSRSAAHVAEAVQGVLQNAERTLENTDQMVARISTLTSQANRIGDILEVIRDIADRSDLLALNGSLEATRAGEAGRGFALVAAEMRRLAERVTGSVEDIKTLVAEIRESGASTVVATEESKKLAQKTTEAARNITLVTQQQRTSTEQVSQSVRGIAEIVEQSATATMQTRSSAEGLKVHADRLTALVQQFQLQA